MSRKAAQPEQVDEEQWRQEFLAWARSPMPKSDGEPYPVGQMGPDGKRKARYRKGVVPA